MLTCHDVAKYFLSLADDNAGDLMSNLKLQKLVYYAQGFYLATYGEPLFMEPIKAWPHGPVVKELYDIYSQHGSAPIPRAEVDYSIYSEQQREHLDEVYSVYGQFSAWKLRNMTHEEAPWKDAAQYSTLTHAALKAYFDTQLVDEDDPIENSHFVVDEAGWEQIQQMLANPPRDTPGLQRLKNVVAPWEA